jgi:large subunit ribosomal protein L22
MESRAIARYVRVAPRKARLVVDQVRGKSIARATEICQFSDRAVAEVVGKVIDSAVANARQQHQLRPESLYIKTAYVDEGPTMKRLRPRAKGQGARIRKRTCHITIIVAPREEA